MAKGPDEVLSLHIFFDGMIFSFDLTFIEYIFPFYNIYAYDQEASHCYPSIAVGPITKIHLWPNRPTLL